MQNVTGWSGSTPNKRREKWKNNREEWQSVGPPLLALGQLVVWLREVILPLPYPHKRWTLLAVRNADSNNSPRRHMRNNRHLDRTNPLNRIVNHAPLPPHNSNSNFPVCQIAVALVGRCQAHQQRSLVIHLQRPRPSRETHSHTHSSGGRHCQLIGRG